MMLTEAQTLHRYKDTIYKDTKGCGDQIGSQTKVNVGRGEADN